jgi:hypothetical protein
MKTYEVIYKEELIHVFYVEANSPTEAKTYFHEHANEFDFSDGEVIDTRVDVMEVE